MLPKLQNLIQRVRGYLLGKKTYGGAVLFVLYHVLSTHPTLKEFLNSNYFQTSTLAATIRAAISRG